MFVIRGGCMNRESCEIGVTQKWTRVNKGVVTGLVVECSRQIHFS